MELSVVVTSCTQTERMERSVHRSVFFTNQLKGLYVVLSFTAHMDDAAVAQKSSGLVLRSAAEDTGEYVCMCI